MGTDNTNGKKTTTIKRVTTVRRTANAPADRATSDSPPTIITPSWVLALAAAVGGAMAIHLMQLHTSQRFNNSEFIALSDFRDSLGPEWDPTPSTQQPRTQSDVLQRELARAANKGGTRIVNSYIHNATLLQELVDPTLWRTCQQQLYRWIDIPDDDNGDTPAEEHTQPLLRNIWEELAWQIWKDQPEFLGVDDKGCRPVGLEYWCNILDSTSPLEWHVDKDETLYQRTETLVTPTMGAVWYGFPHVLTGGYLELLNYGSADIWVDVAGREIERIRPEYNRLVFLNVSQWHSVSPIFSGTRYTLAVNVWHERPLTFANEEKK